jgi:DNA polymerase III subunit alpha
VERAKELGMPAIALTDHGVMYGAIELIKSAKAGIKPIIGNEMYVINGDRGSAAAAPPRYHLVVLAKNTQGYRNLVKLTSISHLRACRAGHLLAPLHQQSPAASSTSEGLIVTSACLGGEVPQAILQKRRPTWPARWPSGTKEVFGDDFYLEIQDHGSAPKTGS